MAGLDLLHHRIVIGGQLGQGLRRGWTETENRVAGLLAGKNIGG